MVRAGVGPGPAEETARTVLALLEGAFILARASRDAGVVETAGAAAASVVRQAMSG